MRLADGVQRTPSSRARRIGSLVVTLLGVGLLAFAAFAYTATSSRAYDRCAAGTSLSPDQASVVTEEGPRSASTRMWPPTLTCEWASVDGTWQVEEDLGLTGYLIVGVVLSVAGGALLAISLGSAARNTRTRS